MQYNPCKLEISVTAGKERVTVRCEAAPSELPMRLITALLQQEPQQMETWEMENWPPARAENNKLILREDSFFLWFDSISLRGRRVSLSCSFFFWPYLCLGLSSVKPGPPQACEWSLPLRTNWSLQTLQTSTTCSNMTETETDICKYKRQQLCNYIVTQF